MDQLQKFSVVLRGGGLDESPHCYKRLPEVLAEQGDTVGTSSSEHVKRLGNHRAFSR